jgi:hypothetical protein
MVDGISWEVNFCLPSSEIVDKSIHTCCRFRHGENHLFSLSCVLYPHVVATPDYKLRLGLATKPLPFTFFTLSPHPRCAEWAQHFFDASCNLPSHRSQSELVDIHRAI